MTAKLGKKIGCGKQKIKFFTVGKRVGSRNGRKGVEMD